MLTRKNAQLSIFVVVGVILVVVTTFLFFNSQFEFFQSYDTRLKNQVSDIVEGCIQTSTDNGLFLLGFQGGYINLDEVAKIDPERHVDFGLKIATWDTQRGDVPTRESMQNELEDFIEQETVSCITADLATVSDVVEVLYTGALTADVTINDENVLVSANMPLSFKEVNSPETLSIEDYFIRADSLRLGSMHDLAVQIYNLETETEFVEDLVLDQIFSASDYSSPISMPSQGMHFSCSQRVWTIPQLKESLAHLNNNNFKYLYFDGTYPIDEVFDTHLDGVNGPVEYRDYYLNNYVFELEDASPAFRNYRVEVMMPSTEITGDEGITQRYPYRTFEVSPSSGDIIKPISMKVGEEFNVPIPCIQVYHHIYTLDYDLVVRLTDYNDDGELYLFQFPIRVLIDKNNPKDDNAAAIALDDRPTATSEVFCSDDSRQYPLQVFAADNYGNYLKDVNITYKCINLVCEVGQTKRPTFQGVTRDYAEPFLETDFPYCVGGTIVAEKEGYHKGKLRVDTTDELLNRDTTQFHDIVLIPIKEFEIDESTFLIVDRETNLGRRVLTEEDGSIYMSIENIEHDFYSQAIWPNDGEIFNKIKLLDQENVIYNVSVYYMNIDYELEGLIDVQDIEIDVNSGNYLEVVIPGSTGSIEPDDYEEFYSFMQRAVETDLYGINLK